MSKYQIKQLESSDMYGKYIDNSQLKEILKSKKLSDTITLEEAIILITEACFIFGANYVENPRFYPDQKRAANAIIEKIQSILNQ